MMFGTTRPPQMLHGTFAGRRPGQREAHRDSTWLGSARPPLASHYDPGRDLDPAVHAEFPQDVFYVIRNRPGRQNEAFGDLLVREALRDEDGDLPLARCQRQSVRIHTEWRGLVMGGIHRDRSQQSVELDNDPKPGGNTFDKAQIREPELVGLFGCGFHDAD